MEEITLLTLRIPVSLKKKLAYAKFDLRVKSINQAAINLLEAALALQRQPMEGGE